jgi:hypothetical protein
VPVTAFPAQSPGSGAAQNCATRASRSLPHTGCRFGGLPDRRHAYDQWPDGSPAHGFDAPVAEGSVFQNRGISTVYDLGR